MGIYTGLYDPTFNNYLAEVFGIGEATRGGLEFFRELPGFLVVFLLGMLFFLADIRIATISMAILALGLWGQGFMAPGLSWAVVWMIMWSIGTHLFMPVSNSIVVSLSDPAEVGRKMGKWSAIGTAASLVGYLIVWAGFKYFSIDYRWIFGLAGLAAVGAMLCFMCMSVKKVTRPGSSIFFKRKYSLYYLLSILFGARKQIFLTFGPWVLIKVFNQPVTTFAVLGLVGTTLGIFFKPAVGLAIDRLGERAVIVGESLALVVVCLGYGFASDLFSPALALIIVYACFVADNLLFACLMARATYLNKILDDRGDLTPTLSMGVTVDHAVSMTIPFFAGLLWESLGFRYVFLVAAILSVVNFTAALYIRTGSESVQKTAAGA